jgi:Na+/H+ antiporter NhaD/arsenite permease-like protein
VFFRKKISKTFDETLVDTLASGSTSIAPKLLKISIVTLIAIDVGYVFASLSRIPVSLVICSGTVFLLVVYWVSLNGPSVVKGEQKGLKSLARDINWDIVLFMLSIFLVVQGLKNARVTELSFRIRYGKCIAVIFRGGRSKLDSYSRREFHE